LMCDAAEAWAEKLTADNRPAYIKVGGDWVVSAGFRKLQP
jgi:hypothetical protein